MGKHDHLLEVNGGETQGSIMFLFFWSFLYVGSIALTFVQGVNVEQTGVSVTVRMG